MTLVLTGAGALALTGCGGGGGGGASFVSRRVVVQFPVGFSLAPAELVAEAGKSAAPLDTAATFAVQAPNSDVPGLAMVRDKAGRGVLMGFLPTDGSPLTTRSAAVALLYYALGGFMLPDASRRPLVTLLEADAASVTLAGAIDRKMVANPYVLEGSDAEIDAALKAAYQTLVGTGRAVRAESFQKQIGLTRAVEPILQVEPSGLQSNLEVVQTTGTRVTAVNHSRRFCKVYVYRTGTPNALPKAALQGTPLKLTSTTSLGIFSTINNLTSGQTAYVPVSSDPISLPLAPGSKKTLYEIIIVGASTNDLPRGFYSDPKYADEQAKWIQDRDDLSVQTWWQNLILPIFFEALGIAGLAATTSAVEGSLAAIRAIEAQSVKTLLLNAGKGRLFVAAGDFWALAAESTAVGAKVRAAMTPLYEAAAGQLVAETAAARAALFAKLVARAAVAAVVLLGTGDIGAVLSDTVSAQPAERWSATVFEPTLLLDPTAKTIAPGQRVTFSVKPPPGTLGSISYAWTTDAINATLSSADGMVGNPITTASTSVDLVTTPSTQGKVTVRVVATLTAPSGAKSELGAAQAVISLSNAVVVGTTALGFVKEFGSFNPTIYLFYVVGSPPSVWEKCELLSSDGSLKGFLYKTDYDRGAPKIDQARNTDVSTFLPYGGGSTAFNLGGGTIAFANTAFFGGSHFLAADVDKKLAEFLKITNDEGPVTATFT